MASPDALAHAYRLGQTALRAATVRDAARLWPLLDLSAPSQTYGSWESAMRSLVSRNASAANSLGAEYARAAWATAGETGTFGVVLAGAPAAEQVTTSLRVTSLVAYRQSLGAGMSRESAARSALVRVSGSVSRLVADSGRGTVAASTVSNGGRWTRVPSPGACTFCRMLAGRGAVYRSGINFASHDHCGCSMIAEFGVTGPVAYRPSLRRATDADRTRVRTWLRANPDAA